MKRHGHWGGGPASKLPRANAPRKNVGEPLPVGLLPAGTASSPSALAPCFAKAVPPKPAAPPAYTGPIEPAKDSATSPVPNHKSSLCQFLGKSLHISLDKGDIHVETLRVPNGFKATITCPRLPRRHQGSWTGEVYTDKKSAEHSAAGECLKALMSIPELVANAAKTKDERMVEKQNRFAQREQDKYAAAVQAQVVAGQQLMQQQQLAAYMVALQQQQAAAAQQQQQQQQALAAQLSAAMAAQAAKAAAPSIPGLPGLPPLPRAAAAPSIPGLPGLPPLNPTGAAVPAMSSLGQLGASPNLPNLASILANLGQTKPAP